ncbi:histidine phosphatase family protein [Paenibacillus sp. HB172176]|uniref:phosphoglycerate mutase family protein n=1 Tax=Paenibacillus sp. HB172176 TaxID=2493690 RepID=UPI00143CAF09|nr:histidine phosphatase family protein [Paenibacillus sp. HB172176]
MKLIFIRHGQGVHNTNVPDRLNVVNPRLTDKGKEQVRALKGIFNFTIHDIFIVSPTLRTIETANLLTEHLNEPRKFVHPVVGPRMFPMPEDPLTMHVRCDDVYPLEKIEREHPDFTIQNKADTSLWHTGVNTMPDAQFRNYAGDLFAWIKSLGAVRVFIIAHDGTITNLRSFLGEIGLSRADFLGEAGWIKTEVQQ